MKHKVLTLIVLPTAALLMWAIDARAATTSSVGSPTTCASQGWALTAYREKLTAPEEFAGPGVVFFYHALQQVQAQVDDPVYYVPTSTLGMERCTGVTGTLVDVEVARNTTTGEQLWAVGWQPG